MLRYILRRLLLAIPTLLAVVTIIFVLVRVIPGDPVTAALGDQASQQAIDKARADLGLDKSLLAQYVDYMRQLLTFDLGK
ncbi:MAG TPA: ABC transporter permease, partial [Thermomicrobiales bacterium]|nr:ABC transporter permease [Thermomicrobiales bacterium]